MMDNQSQQTGRLVRRIIHKWMSGIAMRKLGMDPDYIMPEVTGEAFRRRDAAARN